MKEKHQPPPFSIPIPPSNFNPHNTTKPLPINQQPKYHSSALFNISILLHCFDGQQLPRHHDLTLKFFATPKHVPRTSHEGRLGRLTQYDT